MAITGIDLGATNSLACAYQDGRGSRSPTSCGRHGTASSSPTIFCADSAARCSRRSEGPLFGPSEKDKFGLAFDGDSEE